MPKIDKVLIVFLLLIIGAILGYGLRLHHEGKIVQQQSTQAEKDLGKLENQFHESWSKKYSFDIFQGQFKVWPLKNNKQEKQFSYAGAGDNTKQTERSDR